MADKKTIEFQFKDLGGSSKGPDDGPSEDDLRKSMEEEGKRLNKLLGKHSRSSFDFADTEPEPEPELREPHADYLKDIGEGLQKLIDSFSDLGPEDPLREAGATSLEDALKSLDDLDEEFNSWADAMARVNEENDSLGSSLASAATKVGAFGLALVALEKTATFVFNNTLKKWDSTIKAMTDSVDGFSAQVASARAQFQVQEIEDKIRTAQEEGGNIASLEMMRSDVASQLRETVRTLISIFEPLLSLIGELLKLTLGTLNIILNIIKFIVDLIELLVELLLKLLDLLLGWIPGVGWIIKAARKYMESDNFVEGKTVRDFEKAFFDFDDKEFHDKRNVWDDWFGEDDVNA